MSLIEVMTAMVILAFVLTGAVAFVVSGRNMVEYAAKQRTAAQIGMERLEHARNTGYGAVANASDTLLLDGTSYTWTLTVTNAQADPADAGSSYKILEMSVDWPTSRNDPVVLRTAMSP